MSETLVYEIGKHVHESSFDCGYVMTGKIDVVDFNGKASKLLENEKRNNKGRKQYNYRNVAWGMQEYATSKSTIDKLLDSLCDSDPKDNDVILVLFNHEIVKALVDFGISQSQIMFATDNSSIGKFGYIKEQGLHDVTTVSFDTDRSIGRQLHWELNKMKAERIHIISNPPYNNNADLKILEDVFDNVTKLASAHIVHPAGYLHQNLNKPVRELIAQRFVREYGDKIEKVRLFNGNATFGVDLATTAWTITQFDFGKKDGGIEVQDDTNGESYHADDINCITVMGKGFADHNLAELFSSVEAYIYRHGSVDSHNVHCGELTDYSVKLARIIGHTSSKLSSNEGETDKFLKDDYFTMVRRDIGKNLVGKEWEVEGKEFLSKEEHTTTWAFDDNETRMNFVGYLKTKFARFMLAYYKNSLNVGTGELAIVPWLDFTEKWDDKRLVEKFHVTDDQWEFIDKFIPNYYDDYKSGF